MTISHMIRVTLVVGGLAASGLLTACSEPAETNTASIARLDVTSSNPFGEAAYISRVR